MQDFRNEDEVISEKNGFVETLGEFPTLIWNKKVPDAELEKFKQIISKKYNLKIDSYWDIHKWSIENFPDFWKELWYFFDVIASKSFHKVFEKTGSGFLDNAWFLGAKFNFAENLLRVRDDSPALICINEMGDEEQMTFAELYEQVKLYAAAFRRYGLKAGDSVGCYMSNRKEPVIAMLAATSIGAFWGGPLPFYGARAAGNILRTMEPKFILTMDHFQEFGGQFYPLKNLHIVTENMPGLEKVIVVVTKPETRKEDISHIPKSVFLQDFLQGGMDKNGVVPELVFEQLPFNHPIAANFTSGTTGPPKGAVHAAGILIAVLRDFSLHLNLKKGDRVYNHCPVGWSVWDYALPSLALGVTQVLFEGDPTYFRTGFNVWNVFSKHKLTYAFISTAYMDEIERNDVLPEPGLNFDNLKILGMGSSPVKPRNFEFLYKNIKKGLFVGSIYGATEMFGDFTGFDLNLPAYLNECQVPALGKDIHVYDRQGNSVVGKRGELVIVTPNPSFPIYLLKDADNKRMQDTYFSKYKGVWCQNDEGWINPRTKGIVLIGRSDDTINQDGERIGAGDIYFAIDQMEELSDYVCVGQKKWNGDSRAILFVKTKKQIPFTPQLRDKIVATIKRELSLDYIPKLILGVEDIPYNLNHKRMESVVRKIVATNKIPEVANIENPEALKYFCDIPEIVSYNKRCDVID